MAYSHGSQFSRSVVEDVEIIFDYGANNERQYFLPGEEMKGTVLLHLKSPLKVTGLLLNIRGQAKVSWEVPDERQTYKSTEEYLNQTLSVVDSLQNFPRGTHEFGFEHPLPDTLPSVFRGVYGSVSYIVKVDLQTDNAQFNTTTSQPFMVLRRPLLPRESFHPTEMKKSKKYFDGCNFKKLCVKAGLTRWGGVPGEYLFVNGEVTNFTDRIINKITSSLVQTSVYYARKHKVRFRQVISKREDEYTFETLHGRRWRAVKLEVPPYIPDTDLVGCNIMDVTYNFQFKVELEDHDIDVECPVQVGGHPDGYTPLVDVPHHSQLLKFTELREATPRSEGSLFQHRLN